MKKSFYLHLLVLCAILLIPNISKANDYLEKKKHYMVYASGADRIHFKVPVWAYGRAYNYYLQDASRIYYEKNGQEVTIANVCSERYDENSRDTERGTAFVKLYSGMGSVTVTSMAAGTPTYVQPNDQWTVSCAYRAAVSSLC